MEQQLAQQEEFRRRLLESFPDLILVVDREERYTFASSRSRDLLGYEPRDLIGKKISDLDDHSPELASLYHGVVSGQEALASAEYSARHSDGSWRTMRASGGQLVDAEGNVSGVIISVRDITIERKLEQQVVQSERLLVEEDDALEYAGEGGGFLGCWHGARWDSRAMVEKSVEINGAGSKPSNGRRFGSILRDAPPCVHPVSLLLLGVLPGRAEDAASPDEAALRQLNADYVRSFLTCDVEHFRSLLADDFTGVLANGRVIDKADSLGRPGSRPMPRTCACMAS